MLTETDIIAIFKFYNATYQGAGGISSLASENPPAGASLPNAVLTHGSELAANDIKNLFHLVLYQPAVYYFNPEKALAINHSRLLELLI